MARNVERDERDARIRKDRILREGFRLIAQRGIEAVSIQEIADAAEVGVATMYKYYTNKVNLVVNISAFVWQEFIKECEKEVPIEALQKMNAYELIAYYADMMIRLYTRHPDVLRFSSDFKTYINREDVPEEVVRVHLDPLAFLPELFHGQYEAARENGCIRTDIPEEIVYTTCSITMLSMAERYAQGIVWADNRQQSHEMELRCLKEMLLNWVTKKETEK